MVKNARAYQEKDIKLANLQDTLQISVSGIKSSLNDIMQSHEMHEQADLKMIASKLIDVLLGMFLRSYPLNAESL